MTKKNLAIGYFMNEPFQKACEPHLARLREVFFAWPGVLSCRPSPEWNERSRAQIREDLLWSRQNGLLLDTLFNCNCYGDDAISPKLADFVCATLEEMNAVGLFPDLVTTTSPFIASVLRAHVPSLHIRWSVNGRVHGSTGFEVMDELFDSFYASRERQRELNWLKEHSQWAHCHGKEMGIQVNSGCLRQCPFQQFHDNLHGHNRIRQSQVGDQFQFSVFRCRTHYAKKNWEDFIRATWIRPEDLPAFEPFVDVFKLATRRHSFPTKILEAYATYHYEGNLLELMDPNVADLFAPYRIENAAFPKDFVQTVSACPHANDCTHCGACGEILKRVLVRTI